MEHNKNDNIVYMKYRHYVITIKIIDICDWYIYNPHVFKIINIQDVAFNNFEKTDDNIYIINNEYTEHIKYYLSKDVAYYKNFMKEKQYLLISPNYCGYYKNYDHNEYLKEEYFHINGKKEGIYKKYYSHNHIEIEANFINNKLNGQYKLFYYNGKIKQICYYQDNMLHGEFKLYYENGNIKEVCNFKNNIKIGTYKRYDENNKSLTCVFNDEGSIIYIK